MVEENKLSNAIQEVLIDLDGFVVSEAEYIIKEALSERNYSLYLKFQRSCN